LGDLGDGPRARLPHGRRIEMGAKNTIEFQGTTLPETTFGAAEVGRDYVTVHGYKVTVIEVRPESHAMIRTAKGKDLRTKADARCFGPIPAGEPVTDGTTGTDAPADAPAPSKVMPSRKPWRLMAPEELQEAYRLAVGRETTSVDPAYIAWKCYQARKGRITVGAIERRTACPVGSEQVVPLTLLRETTRLLDAAVGASGAKSRSAFIRAALVEKLRTVGGPEANAAADVLAGEAG